MKYIQAFLLLMLLSLKVIAGWHSMNAGSEIPNSPFFQAGMGSPTPPYVTDTNPSVPVTSSYKPSLTPATNHSIYGVSAFPNQFANLGPQAPVYAVSISGSLKQNLERIMRRYHWRLVWKAPYDYNFDGRITGASLPSVIEKLLKPFPLQAIMYMSNRTLAVVTRQRIQDNQ